MTARETRTVIEQSGKDFVASCLDTGNPMWVMENPVTTIEVLGPYTVTTHVRDSAVFETPSGAAAQWVALGDGVVDLPKIVALHRQLCPQASMQLEIITGRPPRLLPYLQQGLLAQLRTHAGGGLLKLRCAGEEGASVYGHDGDRGRAGAQKRHIHRSLAGTAAC